MKQHLLTCFKCPQAVKKQINDVNKSQSNLTPESTTTSLNSENTSTEKIRDLRGVCEGNELNQAEETEAMELIYNLAEHCNIDCLVDLTKYNGKEGIWSKPFTWKAAEKVNHILWWKGICGSSQLSKVALRVLTTPCTSAATERSFSTQGFIHSAKRNRFTSERAAKITFLSYNWNLLNKGENINRVYSEDTVPERSDMEDTDDDMLHDAAMEGHMQEDMESSLREDIWEAMEPVASTSQQTNHIEFVNISECLYDTDSD
ncbi:unnamed protein product [Parnassius apollo]|uniref:(apollo) hypothetical protein n=1 Tax=Parnassius apollo TaxID=110799 RepID=A0A8S3WJ86_PARAO|nr:unnamed protein product [Parnassius apollo]